MGQSSTIVSDGLHRTHDSPLSVRVSLDNLTLELKLDGDVVEVAGGLKTVMTQTEERFPGITVAA